MERGSGSTRDSANFDLQWPFCALLGAYVQSRCSSPHARIAAISGFSDSPAFGERVFHFRRHDGINLPDNHAILFQLAQLGRENARAETGLQSLNLVETQDAACYQVMQDYAFAFATDHLKAGFDTTAGA